MIRKAVIPAAGLGTRFLPATKAQPKEMLPIVDTPTIQFVVEEAVNAGIKDILIITGKGKRAIEDHFDESFELEYFLDKKGDKENLKEIKRIANLANIHFIRQKSQKGLGDAVYYAKEHVGNEPFAVLLGDSLIEGKKPVIKELMDAFEKTKQSIIGVEEVPMDKVSRYGVIKPKGSLKNNIIEIDDLVEKPKREDAPSNLAIGARYILTPEIFSFIEKTPPGKGGEIQLTDAIKLMKSVQKVYAYRFEGKRHDIGNKLDYMKSVVEFALKRDDIGREFKEFLKGLNLR